MYTVIYLFPVPRANVEGFARVQREAAEVYKRYGALDDETHAPLNLEAAYGCAGFSDAFELKEDEHLFVGLSRFRDRAHHDEVMGGVDADERIGTLYAEMLALLEMDRVVRGEFERIV